MLGLRSEEHKAKPVAEDEHVRALFAHLREVERRLAHAEAQEKEFIGVVEGQTLHASQEAREEAYAALSTRKGTQTGWFFPIADSLRAERKKLSTDLALARAAAQARLDEVRRAERAHLLQNLFRSWEATEGAAVALRDFDRESEKLGGSRQTALGEVFLPESDLRQHQRRVAEAQGWLD